MIIAVWLLSDKRVNYPRFHFQSNRRSKWNAQDDKKKRHLFCCFDPFSLWHEHGSLVKEKYCPSLSPLWSPCPTLGYFSVLTLAIASHCWRRELINFTTVISFYNGIIVCHRNVLKVRSFFLIHRATCSFRATSQFLETQ